MSQVIYINSNDRIEVIELPNPSEKVTENLVWGEPDKLFTPAYWAMQAKLLEKKYLGHFKFGKSLEEEIVACILGGYGFRAELGLLAFNKLKEKGLFLKGNSLNQDDIYNFLKEPFLCGSKSVKYRFARQKSKYVYDAISFIRHNPTPTTDHFEFRNWLLKIKGIGLKTASWITRNWLESDSVAVIDIHIYRAGILSNFFSKTDRIDRDYYKLENKFIEYSNAIGARVSALDAIMWAHMRSMPSVVSSIIRS